MYMRCNVFRGTFVGLERVNKRSKERGTVRAPKKMKDGAQHGMAGSEHKT